MNGNLPKKIFAAILIVAGFGVIYLLSNTLKQNRMPLPPGYEDAEIVVQGKNFKGYVLGAEGLLADWYWMQSLQYLGDKIEKSKSDYINVEDLSSLDPRLLYPYLDNATEFDPHYMAAYSFGATVLPAVDKQKAIKLTEKGIANNPNAWRLYQYLGYIYWRQKDYEKAAEVYEKGSHIPGVPPFMRQMMAQMKSQGGDRETARLIYSQMAAEAEDEQTKKNAEFRLAEIDAFDEIDVINSDLEAFKRRSGRCAENWKEFTAYLRSFGSPEAAKLRFNNDDTPVSPIQIPYVFDKTACRASLP